MGFVKGFGQFWYDFIIGDDWKIAAAVLLVLVIGAICVLGGIAGSTILPPLLAIGVALTFVAALLIDTRAK